MSLRDRYPHLYEQTEQELDDDFFEPDSELPSSYMRRSLVEGLRRFDPAAMVTPMLDIRLLGAAFDDGQVNAIAADILIKLQNEIEAASPDASPDSLRIGVGELSRGSLIMHVRPAPPSLIEDGLPYPAPEALERALRRVLDLHDTLESNPEVLPVQTRNERDLHTRLRQLVESLDGADAVLQMDLYESSGNARTSKVSERGRSNARGLFERKPRSEPSVVAGTVDKLEGSGKVRVVVGRSKREIEDVPSDVIQTLHIGSQFRAGVMYSRSEDLFGERADESWKFVRVMPHDEVISD